MVESVSVLDLLIHPEGTINRDEGLYKPNYFDSFEYNNTEILYVKTQSYDTGNCTALTVFTYKEDQQRDSSLRKDCSDAHVEIQTKHGGNERSGQINLCEVRRLYPVTSRVETRGDPSVCSYLDDGTCRTSNLINDNPFNLPASKPKSGSKPIDKFLHTVVTSQPIQEF